MLFVRTIFLSSFEDSGVLASFSIHEIRRSSKLFDKKVMYGFVCLFVPVYSIAAMTHTYMKGKLTLHGNERQGKAVSRTNISSVTSRPMSTVISKKEDFTKGTFLIDYSNIVHMISSYSSTTYYYVFVRSSKILQNIQFLRQSSFLFCRDRLIVDAF